MGISIVLNGFFGVRFVSKDYIIRIRIKFYGGCFIYEKYKSVMFFVRYFFDMLIFSNYVLIFINYLFGFLGLYLFVYFSKIYSKVLRTKLIDGNLIWIMEYRNKILGEVMDFLFDFLYGLYCFLWKYV